MRRPMLALVLWLSMAPPLAAQPAQWRAEWPQTDFTRHSVSFAEIIPGGPPKDGIPSIDEPAFVPAAAAALPDNEPVIGLIVGGDARAYPLRILIWHEIVNDVIGGVPVAVTYCPLCNTGIVFDRRVGSYAIAEALGARGIPFIFVTGYGEEGVDPRYAAVEVLQKPFDPRTLQRSVAATLAKLAARRRRQRRRWPSWSVVGAAAGRSISRRHFPMMR